MMKFLHNLKHAALMAFAVLVAVSCTKPGPEPDDDSKLLMLDQTEIYIPGEGLAEAQVITVLATDNEWQFQTDESATWLTVSAVTDAEGAKALAKELGPSGITVNAIAPGVIATDMNSHLGEEDMKALAEETPAMRIGSPEEVANAALYLAGEGASFITGDVLNISGGFVV